MWGLTGSWLEALLYPKSSEKPTKGCKRRTDGEFALKTVVLATRGKRTERRPARDTSQGLSQAVPVASARAGVGMEKGRRFRGI